MDIAKYIGLFLIKNEYCYLPGIGSLQVEKKSAIYNPSAKQMDPPEYEVVFKKSAGSIDDSFANFVANNERISIAHAANFFKDYCATIKNELREGNEVEIPAIGKFSMAGNEEIQFSADPHLQIKGKSIPFFKISPIAEKQQEEALTNIINQTEIKEPKGDEKIVMKPPQVNWVKIIVLIVLILGILGAIFYFAFLNNVGKNSIPDEMPNEEQPYGLIEESSNETTAEEPAVAEVEDANDTQGNNNYIILINNYPTRERAERRVGQLRSYGHNVELQLRDSGSFNVVMNLPPDADTTKILDSLNKLFGGGIKVLR